MTENQLDQATNEVNITIMSDETLQEAAECLKVMAHPARLKIVQLLMQGEFPVHELARHCKTAPHQMCEHLRLLKGRGLLDSERRGRTVYYSIVSPQLPALLNCISKNCEMLRSQQ